MSFLKAILIFIVLIPCFAFSKKSELTCSKSGTTVFFINGVLVDDQAFLGFKRESDIFFSKLQKSEVDILSNTQAIARHNQSEGLLRDIAESYFLYLNRDEEKEEIPMHLALKLLVTAISDDKNKKMDELCKYLDKKDLCQEIKKIIFENENSQTIQDLGIFKKVAHDTLVKEGKKLIFVTHSGGNLMADRVRDYIRHHLPSEYYAYTGHVSLARPYHTSHKNVETIIFEQDGIISGMRDVADQNTPDANVDLLERCDTFSFLPWFNHGFDCYLGNNIVKQTIYNIGTEVPSVEVIKAAVYKVATKLENNDEKCCDKQKNGKIWLNSTYSSVGGFVSDETIIKGENISIMKGAQLCGQGTINAESVKYRYIGEKVILDGEYSLPEEFTIYNFQMTKRSKFQGGGEKLFLEDSTIDGNLTISELSGLYNFHLFGNLEIVRHPLAQSGLDGTGLINTTIKTSPSEKSFFQYGRKFRLENTTINMPVSLKATHPESTIEILNSNIHKMVTSNSVLDAFLVYDSELEGNLTIASRSVELRNTNIKKDILLNGGTIRVENSDLKSSISHSCPYASIYLYNVILEASNSFRTDIINVHGSSTNKAIVSNSTFGSICGGTVNVGAANISGFNLQTDSFIGGNVGSGISTDTTNGSVTAIGNIASGTHFIGPVNRAPYADGDCDFSGTVQPGIYCYPTK